MDRKRYLDNDEVRELRRTTEDRHIVDLAKGRVKGPVAWMVVDLALSTGLRVSEIAALTCGDVDFKRKLLTVRRLKRKRPLTETMAMPPELAAHLKDFIEWKQNADQGTAPTDALLVGKRGELSPSGLQQIWRGAAAAAGLEQYSIHCARHTCAVRLYAKTKDLRLVQKRLGHSSPVVTANMYAAIPFEDELEAVTGLYE